MIHRALEKMFVFLGKVPSCGWARARFGVYYAWDSSLSKREFLAVEQHPIDCPDCAVEYEVVHEVRNAFELTLAAEALRGALDGRAALISGENEKHTKGMGIVSPFLNYRGSRW